MLTRRVSTASVPPAERFAWWRETRAASPYPTLLHSPDPARFHVSADILELGDVRVTSLTYAAVTSVRTPQHIRRSDPDYYNLSLGGRGTMAVSQARQDEVFGPGELCLYDGSLPSSVGASEPLEHILVQLPKSVLPFPPGQLQRLAARRLTHTGGFAVLLGQFLTQLTRSAHQFREQDAARLSTSLLDLLGGVLAQHLDEERALSPESRQRALFLRVQDHCRRHLGDPELGPATIAAAHHISLRYLHRLFQQHGLTVTSWITRQRLEGCRRDLADPAQWATPVQAVAARWGFRHPAAFSRAFRSAYGVPPGEYRHACRQGHEDGREHGLRDFAANVFCGKAFSCRRGE